MDFFHMVFQMGQILLTERMHGAWALEICGAMENLVGESPNDAAHREGCLIKVPHDGIPVIFQDHSCRHWAFQSLADGVGVCHPQVILCAKVLFLDLLSKIRNLFLEALNLPVHVFICSQVNSQVFFSPCVANAFESAQQSIWFLCREFTRHGSHGSAVPVAALAFKINQAPLPAGFLGLMAPPVDMRVPTQQSSPS